MIPEAVISSIIVGYIRHGSLKNVNLEIRGWYLIIISAIIQTIAIRLDLHRPGMINSYYFFIHMISYILLIIGIVMNIRLKAFRLLLIGTLLNLTVIIFNSGKMPCYVPWGKITRYDILHVEMNETTMFKFLGDIIPIPRPYPFPKIISIGDIFIIFGAFIFVQVLMKPSRQSKSKANYIN